MEDSDPKQIQKVHSQGDTVFNIKCLERKCKLPSTSEDETDDLQKIKDNNDSSCPDEFLTK